MPLPVEALWTCAVLAMVVSGTSFTITGTEVFEPMRRFLSARSEWLGHLTACFYCTSHWVTFLLVALCRPVLVSTGFLIVDLAISAFFVVQLAAYLTGLLFKSYSVIIPVKAAMQQAMEAARAAHRAPRTGTVGAASDADVPGAQEAG
ncbi:conserved hypothetical protein [Anaeromyxobacter dehalogenans 2CP-1]|uniref:DUF1360 domain-containing protein n=1 Tax=Anaeromyxobacter dehalogenans (strain ATCC BAA-258 / DSM 21875 / 2CP-1) TaxID=455488 RepID=B8JF87_ANAD2|nr:DUF1360 domain-containing protein [Anaeromyxobacter dehalogenans]ACL64444.1 conserved hypothetical protein [Anaeromyxobacter dehalogenans 2CP-1]